MKILIIRLSAIGDIFHTCTILPDLRNQFKDVQIDWLVDDNLKGIVELSPLVNNIIPIPLKKWKKNKLSFISNLIKFKKSLPNTQYDYIIDTQGLIKTALITKFLFKGNIYGLDSKSARESLASMFYDYKFNVAQNNVAVVRLRGLIAKIFNLEHNLRDYSFKIKNVNYQSGYDNYVIFIHGASKENKKWSLNNWVALSHWIIANTNNQIIVTYSNNSEYQFTQELQTKLNSSRLTVIDKLSFEYFAGLIKKANYVIGVDTGFTHLANLLHVPTIAIYQATDPGYVGMVESDIAKNLGGKGLQVSVYEVVEQLKIGLN